MEIYLIRHTSISVDHGVCYGQSDVELAESFDQEREQLLNKLPDQFDAIYSSPLQRCRILSEHLKGSPICIDDRLIELNFGDWEMKRWDDLGGDTLDKWMNNFVSEKPPNGECFEELRDRVMSFLDEITKNSHNTVALITHAGVIRTMITQILRMPLENAFKLKFNYGSISLVHYKENAYHLACFNK